MASKYKYLLIALIILFQFSAIMSLFVNKLLATFLFIGYALSIAILIGLFIKERLKEKKEEDENDYSDY